MVKTILANLLVAGLTAQLALAIISSDTVQNNVALQETARDTVGGFTFLWRISDAIDEAIGG